MINSLELDQLGREKERIKQSDAYQVILLLTRVHDRGLLLLITATFYLLQAAAKVQEPLKKSDFKTQRTMKFLTLRALA